MTLHRVHLTILVILILAAVIMGGFGVAAYTKSSFNELSANSLTVDGAAVLANYTGLDTKHETSNGFAAESDTVTTIVYRGEAVYTITLPAARVSRKVVIVFSEPVISGTFNLIIDCPSDAKFATGSLVPTSEGGNLRFTKSTDGQNRITYTPVANNTNVLTTGSAFEFICAEDDIWQVNVFMARGIVATVGSLTGSILFSSQ
jgi:hypothetical protein